MRTLRHLGTLLAQLWTFAWKEKVWWMLPMVLGLLALGALVVGGQAVTPFLYALF
jgi:hypothetical protein